MRLSIIRRTVAVVFAGLFVLTLGFWWVLHTRLQRDVDTILASRTRSAMALVVTDRGRLGVEETPLDESLETSFWLYDAQRRVVAAPVASPGLTRAASRLIGSGHRADVEGTRLLATPVIIRGSALGTLVVALPLAPFTSSEHVSIAAAGLLDLIMVLATLGLTNRTMRSALRPVELMTATAQRWSEHDVERRFLDTGDDDELAHLAHTLNLLLARLGSLVRHEQRVTAEIAHEIKTPLARITTSAEITLAYGTRAEKDRALADVVSQSLVLATVVDDLLLGATTQSSPGRCDAGAVLHAHAADLEGAAADIAVTVRAVTDMSVGCDASTLLRMLAPLTANAVKHAASGVLLAIERSGATIIIDVLDDGDGFLAGEVGDVFRPGYRGQSAQGTGSGLGLSLSRRLAVAAAGRVETLPGEGGHIRIHLPAG